MVWFFDASKQAFAGVLQHFVNLIFGIVFARSGRASECAWYLVNFTISVACGVVILWGTMRLYTYTVERFDLTILRSGEYGSPPSWRPWMAQMLIWGVFASGEKLITAVAVIVPLHPRLDEFAARLETPVVDAPFTELLLVMVVAPVILNMLFFWVIDSIIMRKRPGDSHHYPEGRHHLASRPASPRVVHTAARLTASLPPPEPQVATRTTDLLATSARSSRRAAAAVRRLRRFPATSAPRHRPPWLRSLGRRAVQDHGVISRGDFRGAHHLQEKRTTEPCCCFWSMSG